MNEFKNTRPTRQDIPRVARTALSVLGYAVLIALLLGMSAPDCNAVALRAGVAKADITPPAGLPMYGFLDRLKDNKVSTGTLDPLYARVLVLEAGEKRLALVTLDLGRTFRESELAQLRQRLKATAGISFLIVTASHTHSGPNILDQEAGGKLQAWETSAIEKTQPQLWKLAVISSMLRLALDVAKFISGITAARCNRTVPSRCCGQTLASSPRRLSIRLSS